ncbi:MAG: PepSY domain-containing protein, partial [Jaaginema sp. PMC 1079.18]|nr:PepSY domain-containing protein [Jaaginema sp. PMC 1079.18]
MQSRNFRKLHRVLAPIVFIPLFLTATTGVLYRVGSSWFGTPPNFSHWMMYIHQGDFLGGQLRVVYVLLNG